LNLDTDDDEIADVQREIRILSHCDSDYITRYHGSAIYGTKLWVIMDFAGAGSVRDMLRMENFDEKTISVLVREVLNALVYLHTTCHIIHRDIKAANVLLTSDGLVKLCDFGVSNQLTMQKRSNSFVGSPYWSTSCLFQADPHSGTRSYSEGKL
jgi:serine/threonine protein kinase